MDELIVTFFYTYYVLQQKESGNKKSCVYHSWHGFNFKPFAAGVCLFGGQAHTHTIYFFWAIENMLNIYYSYHTPLRLNMLVSYFSRTRVFHNHSIVTALRKFNIDKALTSYTKINYIYHYFSVSSSSHNL